MADNEEELNDIRPPANSGGGKNPLLTILVILNTVLIGAVGFFQFKMHKENAARPDIRDVVTAEMKKQLDTAEKGTGEAREEKGILFPLEGFTANLAQGDGPRRFVRLNTVLEFSRDSKEEEFQSRKPQIRDAIISTLNTKRPADLLSLEGKNYLKEEIKASINSFLVDGKVIDVYYVGFQIN